MKRRRKDNWEFVVRRKHLLPRPLYFTFDTEEEGDRYCQRLEALFDLGVIPDEIRERAGERPERPSNLSDAIDSYLHEHKVADSDEPLLLVLSKRIGQDALWTVDDVWARKWIESLERERKLAPGTIRHQVGALSRCLDWIARNKPHLLAVNPLRSLPRGYSAYSPRDVEFSGVERGDTARDRRLSADEDLRIRSVLTGEKREDRQRPLELNHRSALRCLYGLLWIPQCECHPWQSERKRYRPPEHEKSPCHALRRTGPLRDRERGWFR